MESPNLVNYQITRDWSQKEIKYEESGSSQQVTGLGNTTLTTDGSPIQSLPIELLVLIFLECLRCPDSGEGNTTPVTLRKVCRLWESVICGLSSVWKNLQLHRYPLTDLEDVLNEYFCYRGHHKLEVDVSIYGNIEYNYPRERIKPLGIIRDNFRHLKSITGAILPAALYELFGQEYSYDMRTIRTLDLEISSWTSRDKFPLMCSDSFQLDNIETLKLYNLGYLLCSPNIKSFFPHLTVLSLKGDHARYLLDHSMVLTILSVAANLQGFFWSPSRDLGEGRWPLLTTVKLLKLTKLHINLQPFSMNVIPILNALEMPRLIDCHIDGYSQYMIDLQSPIYFISTHGIRIQELTLKNSSIGLEIWKHICQRLPSLKRLYIEGEFFQNEFFQYLLDNSTRLPKLECLTVFRRVFQEKEAETLLNFVQSREDARENRAQLKTLRIACTIWHGPEFQSMMDENKKPDLDWQLHLSDVAVEDSVLGAELTT